MTADDWRRLSVALQRRSPVTRAVVVAPTGDGKYTVRDAVTGSTYTADLGTSTAPKAGQVALVIRDAVGRSVGTVPVIVGFSLDPANGVIAPPRADDVELYAPVITVLPTYPVTLVKGGSAVSLLMYGIRLSGASLGYGSVQIVDDVAQVPSATQVSFSPKATASCPLGMFSLSITGTRGLTIPDFFEVIT